MSRKENARTRARAKKSKHDETDSGDMKREIVRDKAYMIDIDGVVCVKPDTLILGDNKEISALEAKDCAFGLTGLNRIQTTFHREYSGEMIRAKAQGLLPLEVTPEHPLLVSSSTVNFPTIQFGPLSWKHASDLKEKKHLTNGDYLVLPRLKGLFDEGLIELKPFVTQHGEAIARAQGVPLRFPLTGETSWLMGLYVAEGCPIRDSSRGKEIYASQFTLGSKENELAAKLVRAISNLGYKARMKTVGSVTVVVLQSRILSKMLAAKCGIKATHKQIPEVILLHKDLELLRSFLRGYLDGDGSKVIHGFTAVTVSKVLALQLQLLCARLGFPLSITESYSGDSGLVLGRNVKLHRKYRLHAIVDSGPRRKMKVFDDHILCPIRKVSSVRYTGSVHNIETSDNTYLVSNAVVHNCEHVDNEYPEKMVTVEEIVGAKEWINSKYDEGNYICFFTARLESHREVTENWLRAHGFKFHEVIFGKPRGGNYHYIDKAHVQATTFKGRFTPLVSETHGIEVFREG